MDRGEVKRALTALYGIETVALRDVVGGQDARARTYSVEAADDRRYLVKTRAAGEGRDVAAAVTHYLKDAGLPQVVAPLTSIGGDLTPEHGDLSLTVYPYVEGQRAVDIGLSDEQWRSLGAMTRALHELRLPGELDEAVPRDGYWPEELGLMPVVDEAVADGEFQADEVSNVVALFWAARRREIIELGARTADLGAELAERGLPLVLCHADLHTWNVLVDATGAVWVVDWDEVVLAPKERDLMFVVGGIGAGLVTADQTARFLDGYGSRNVDELALAYYRHAWAVQDVVSYAGRVLLERGPSVAERAEAARILVGLFAPGEIVDLAFAWRGLQ